jgi:plasmid maintenance system antidote protein VapI
MREIIERLGIGQTELARWLGVGDRTIRHYIKGDRDVPPSLALLLIYLIDRPEALAWFRDRDLARLMGMGD